MNWVTKAGRSHSRSPTKHKRTRSLSAPRSPAYMKREKKSLRSDATDTHISDVSGDGHEGDYAAANLIVSRRSPSPSIREALEEQVREVEAEKMALQVQKAKLEVTSDKQISYRMSINVAHSLVWQNMCKLTNIIEMHSGLVMLSIFAN
jgi:hypothetical protein